MRRSRTVTDSNEGEIAFEVRLYTTATAKLKDQVNSRRLTAGMDRYKAYTISIKFVQRVAWCTAAMACNVRHRVPESVMYGIARRFWLKE